MGRTLAGGLCVCSSIFRYRLFTANPLLPVVFTCMDHVNEVVKASLS
jgi:hypothetical protein